MYFNGSIRITIVEAKGLRPTDFATRHNIGPVKNTVAVQLDPYASVDVDDVHIGRTTTKQRTENPHWEEEVFSDIHNGQNLQVTIFHDAAIPPDQFVANCSLPFEDLMGRNGNDIWVIYNSITSSFYK